MSQENIPFEVIIIEDGSTDKSYEIAEFLESENDNVWAYQLSRNRISHYAIFAGLRVCSGDCAMPIPDDEQRPYSSIVGMYRLWEKGSKVIIPYREKRDDGLLNAFFSNFYCKIINRLSEFKFPKGGADLFFINREVIDILNSCIRPINASSIIEVLRVGFSPDYFSYVRVEGDNPESRWAMKKKIRLFKDTFFSSFTWRVKVITNLGLFFSLFALGTIILYTYIQFFEILIFGENYFRGELLQPL